MTLDLPLFISKLSNFLIGLEYGLFCVTDSVIALLYLLFKIRDGFESALICLSLKERLTSEGIEISLEPVAFHPGLFYSLDKVLSLFFAIFIRSSLRLKSKLLSIDIFQLFNQLIVKSLLISEYSCAYFQRIC